MKNGSIIPRCMQSEFVINLLVPLHIWYSSSPVIHTSLTSLHLTLQCKFMVKSLDDLSPSVTCQTRVHSGVKSSCIFSQQVSRKVSNLTGCLLVMGSCSEGITVCIKSFSIPLIVLMGVKTCVPPLWKRAD